MTIDVLDDDLVSLADLAKLLPALRAGRPVHVTTLTRWATHGARGRKLACVRVGSRLCTTPAALRHFVALVSGEPCPAPRKKRVSA